jgi:GNAT superfamily N-acetyltransferase
MRVRRVASDEWQRWRDFRFAMFKEAPYAFGTTYAEATARPDSDWQERTTLLATDDDQVLFLATGEDDDWLASAGGYVEDGVPNVFGVWTRPDARGNGYADACVRSVVEWARRRGTAEVHLWVTDTNEPAKRVYERLGFAPTGRTQPHPGDDSLTEAQYALPL